MHFVQRFGGLRRLPLCCSFLLTRRVTIRAEGLPVIAVLNRFLPLAVLPSV
jgi:hypothetical protein